MQTKGTIAFGSDHAGFAMKNELMSFLKNEGYEVVDHGAYKFDPEDDYPDFVTKVAREVSRHPDMLRGIVIGGSGNGEAMVCNKFPGVRSAVYHGGNVEIVSLSREHNDANILSLGARFIDVEEAKIIVLKWLNTPFSEEERHVRRIQKIENIYNQF